MKDFNVLVCDIEFKAKKLVGKTNDLMCKNEELLKKNQELSLIIENQKNNIKNIEGKINILKITKTIEKGKEITETKLKINSLVRDIEKCIALLNK